MDRIFPAEQSGASLSSVSGFGLSQSAWSRWGYDLVISIVIPAVFLFTAPIQLFLPPGWVDAGIYLGLSQDYFQVVSQYGWSYYALRVSYLLPAYLLNTILPAVPARLVIVAGFYLLGTASLYVGSRLIWGRMAATVAVAALAYNPIYVTAVTAGYVDGAGTAYLLLLFAVLAAWSRSMKGIWLAVSGAASVLAVLAHPVSVVAVTLLFGVFNAVHRETSKKYFIRNSLLWILGAAAVWLAFAGVLSGAGFGFGSFRSMRWIIKASANGLGANYRLPLHDWIPAATRLVVSPFLILALLVTMKNEPNLRNRIRQWAVLLMTIATAAVYPILDLVFGGVLTQVNFYAAFGLPAMLIATAEISRRLEPSRLPYKATVALITTSFAIALIWMAPYVWELAGQFSVDGVFIGLCTAALTVVLFIAFVGNHGSLPRAIGLVLVAALQCFATTLNGDTRQVFRASSPVDNVEFFRAASVIGSIIKSSEGPPLFWFNRPDFATYDGASREIARPIRFGGKETFLTFYDTLAGLRLWDKALFSAELDPRMTFDKALLSSRRPITLVVLGQKATIGDEARAILGKEGFRCRQRRTETVQEQSFMLQVVLIDVVGYGETVGPPCGE